MTNQEIAQALEQLIREDAKRPSEDQIRDLIEAGVIDEQGRVLIGGREKMKQKENVTTQNGPSDVDS
jgi:hypothetical protein